MNIVRYKSGGAAQFGVVEDGFVYEADGDVYSAELGKGALVGGLESVALLAPCEPQAITSIGANYASRCKENNLAIPTEPGKGDRFFIPTEALTGPGASIGVPEHEARVEYSGELAIVMGRTCSTVTIDEAPDYILGYTIVHNVWAKNPARFADTEKHTVRAQEWTDEKPIRAYESFCPTGPWVVTDLDPSNLAWQTRVNGEVRQRANTSEMLFSAAEIVANISSWHTLQPGDLIQTGTSEGVGLLSPGDVVEIEFDGIGVLRNIAVVGQAKQPVDLIWIEAYEGD